MTQRIQVIVNPSSGDAKPEIDLVEKVFEEQNVSWQLSVTKYKGDIQRLAKLAVAEGVDVVAVYGGDGTLNEAAQALISTRVPLGILPGGTGNVMALELGIPKDIAGAASLICGLDSQVIEIDVGQMGNHCFLLRAGFGFEAGIIADTDRSQKKQMGLLAYVWNGLRNLRDPEIAEYRFRIDGDVVEAEGFVATVVNAGSLGIAGLHLGRPISLHDGLLDLLVIKEPNWQLLLGVMEKAIGDGELTLDEENAGGQRVLTDVADVYEMVDHWQGTVIEVEMQPKQYVQYDGEPLDVLSWPLECKALSAALRVIVPS
jgi:diacylglycerol kinase (ATP)